MKQDKHLMNLPSQSVMKTRHNRLTRAQHETQRGKKSLFAWIEADLKDWLDEKCQRDRRTLSECVSIILEKARIEGPSLEK
jgi:pyrroloquinoline quinone (PQQ) biosynthesis protein C